MKHCPTPYESFLCDDDGTKEFEEDAERTDVLSEIDCPDCIECIWEIIEEAVV